MSEITPFHLAFPVHDISAAREFYGGLLECPEGRSDEKWVDFDLYGHQIVAHQSDAVEKSNANPVDGHDVPIPHFGVVLPWEKWQTLATKLQEAKIKFIIDPYIRFEGEVGEQATMFFKDPSGNALEFKAFRNIDQLFAK